MAKFSHECPEWDFLVIDEGDMEFLACSCYDDPEAKAASAHWSKELEKWHEREPGLE